MSFSNRILTAILLLTSSLLAQDRSGLKEKLLALAAENDGLGLCVETMDGERIAAVRADESFIPASNNKLITAALALELLGPDFELRTTLRRSGPVRGSRVQGDLLVQGGGDPTISSRFRGDGAEGLLREWARQLVNMGIRSVSGDLVLDTRGFTGPDRHPTWPKGQFHKWYSAGTGALNLGDGCLEVRISAGSEGAYVVVDPPLSGLVIDVQCPLVDAEAQHSLRVDLADDLGRLSVKGAFYRRAQTFTHFVAVRDPTKFFGEALRTALEAEGVAIKGKIRQASSDDPGAEELPLLAAHTTPLRVALGVLLKRSQNLYAESLFKLCGKAAGGTGSYLSGQEAAEAFLKRRELPFTVVDGSGLSRSDRITPAGMVSLLRWASQRPWADDFYTFLPVSGVDGTLRKRLGGKARGRVLAKTGTLNGVSALSGFAIRADKEILIFSMIVNNPRLGTSRSRAWQDRMVNLFFEGE